MHPVLRQSPPSRSDSTIATRAFAAAAIYADTNPAEPAPMTTRLNSKERGRVHRISSIASSQQSLKQALFPKADRRTRREAVIQYFTTVGRRFTSTAFYSP